MISFESETIRTMVWLILNWYIQYKISNVAISRSMIRSFGADKNINFVGHIYVRNALSIFPTLSVFLFHNKNKECGWERRM